MAKLKNTTGGLTHKRLRKCLFNFFEDDVTHIVFDSFVRLRIDALIDIAANQVLESDRVADVFKSTARIRYQVHWHLGLMHLHRVLSEVADDGE